MRKKSSKKKTPPNKIKLDNGTHEIKACGLTKAEAEKKKAAIRKKGNSSRILKIDGKRCVTKGPKLKRVGRRKTASSRRKRTSKRA